MMLRPLFHRNLRDIRSTSKLASVSKLLSFVDKNNTSIKTEMNKRMEFGLLCSMPNIQSYTQSERYENFNFFSSSKSNQFIERGFLFSAPCLDKRLNKALRKI